MVPGRVVMEDVPAVGGTLKAWSVGSGEPVLLIHGAFTPDVFGPLIEQPDLSGHRFIGYRRRGYVDSAPSLGDESYEAYASEALSVLDHFGVDRAHVVGHSFSGRIALELGRQAEKRVQSLSLLDSGGPSDLVVPGLEGFGTSLAEAVGTYQAGERQAALEIMLNAIGGESSRHDLNQVLAAGWFEQAVADIGTLFEYELHAGWDFSITDLTQLTMPAMVMTGERSAPFLRELSAALAARLPNCETIVAAGVNHWLHMSKPDAVAPHLAAFLNRNRMS